MVTGCVERGIKTNEMEPVAHTGATMLQSAAGEQD